MSAQLLWKIVKVLAPAIAGAIIGGLIVGKVRQVQIDAGKVEIAKTQQELVICQDANATGRTTIESLKDEVSSALKGCETRLRAKEKTLSEIRMIDGITVKRGDNETNGDRDPLLDLLNGMYDAGGQADRQD